MTQKSSKGEVQVKEHKPNRLYIQFPRELFDGKQRYLSLELSATPENWKIANTKKAEIERDIAFGMFDHTLAKYKSLSKNASERLKREIERDLILLEPTRPKPLLPLWDEYVKSLCLDSRTASDHYPWVRKMIEKAGDEATTHSGEWLKKHFDHYAARTFNDRLSYLKSFGDWLVEEQKTQKNPFTRIKPKKGIKEDLKPFTLEEIQAIVTAFETNQFCPKKSAFKHSHYAPYVKFLFFTGCRPGEAVGLQWKHVNFERETIHICSVLARSDDGSFAAEKRVRKTTKTGSNHYLPCKGKLKELLQSIKPEKCKPDDLVFPSPEGLPIHHENFRKRQWKVVLEGLELDYRKPYTARHSFASHAIEQGKPMNQVASMLGHSDSRMVATTYGHLINQPDLPEIF